MNVFKRLSDIINSNLNAALDKIEDPEKMIDLSIRELEDAIFKLKSDLRERKAELKRAEETTKELSESIERWTNRAKIAAEKNEDDLAREALLEKRDLKGKLGLSKESEETLKNLIAVTEENIKDAELKLSELKATSSTLKARAKLAKDRMEVNKRANEGSSASYERRLEELKMKIERWESAANIGHSDIKEQKISFEDLERDDEIEKELESLKRGKENEKNE